MKIILVDNFNRESISDILIAENVINHYAIMIVDKMNNDIHEDSPYFYKAVKNEYKLYDARKDLNE